MKIKEFAKAVGVHPLTVRRWIKEGKVKATRKQLRGFVYYLDIDGSEKQKVLGNENENRH